MRARFGLAAVRLVLLLPVAFAAGCGDWGAAGDPARPNVIVIVADDLGWADVGYHGSPIKTPHIDRLAAEGVRFERFYTQPWCGPTRAALLTGRFPGSFAWAVPASNVQEGAGIDPDEYTLAERFRDAGYATALIGKWHQGTRPESHPNQNGFDYFYGLLGGYIGYFSKSANQGPHDWQRNGIDVVEPGYATTLLGEDATRFIRERDASKPFFLVMSFNAPHFPQEAPAEVVEEYRGSPSCELSPAHCPYMAQVDVMDREIGRIVETLESERIRTNSLLVFFSDNGGFEAFGGSNQPLRGGKASVYEGGIRVVAFANWPGVLGAGRVSTQRMQVADLFATLEAAAGLPTRAPPDGGSNLWPTIAGASEVGREPFLFMAQGPEPQAGSSQERALLTDSWKLVVTEGGKHGASPTFALFDVGSDPNESSDRSEQKPEVVRRLLAMLEELEQTVTGGARSRPL